MLNPQIITLNGEEYLNRDAVAAELGCSSVTVYRLALAKKIRHLQHPGKKGMLFLRSWLDDYIRAQTVAPTRR